MGKFQIRDYQIFICLTLWWTNSLQWKMAIDIVDFPIKSMVDLSIAMLLHQRVRHVQFMFISKFRFLGSSIWVPNFMLAWLVILPWTRFFFFPSHVVFSHIPATRQECLVNFNCIPKKWTNIDYIVIFVGDPSMLTMRLYQFYPFFSIANVAGAPGQLQGCRRLRRMIEGQGGLCRDGGHCQSHNRIPIHKIIGAGPKIHCTIL